MTRLLVAGVAWLAAFGLFAAINKLEAPEPRARQIAAQLIEPLRAKYEEVLIYVRPIGSPVNALTRRISWTPGGGFVESSY